jgi:hypothetical protein
MKLDQNGEQLGNPQILMTDRQEAEIRIEGAMKLVITPIVQPNGNVTVGGHPNTYDGGAFISSPVLEIVGGEEAEVRIASEGGDSFGIRITPTFQ